MATVEFKGKTFEVDEDGFLTRGMEQWCPEWVDYVKQLEGITELNDDHWKVINVLQDYFKKNGIAPMVRILSKTTGYPLKKIYELFPSGPGKGACKMAGLPKPTGCV
ncbi:MAG: TusE/DsrC/DsvC family sulfur relay protein [Deltaproteobacteria bacterium]